MNAMWSLVLHEYAQFALHTLTGLVLLASAWLYVDALCERKNRSIVLETVGFALLALSFFLQATVLQSALLGGGGDQGATRTTLALAVRIAGYGALFLGAIFDVIPKKPRSARIILPILAIPPDVFFFLPAILAFGVGSRFLYRALVGLEDHIRPVAYAFFCLEAMEIVRLGRLFLATDNSQIYLLVRPFGLLWLLGFVLQTLATLILLRWVFRYLLRQFVPQLVIVLVTVIFSIFLLTTLIFSFVLVTNLREELSKQLETTAAVVKMAIDQKMSENSALLSIAVQNDRALGLLQKPSPALDQWIFTIAEELSFTHVSALDLNGNVLSAGRSGETVAEQSDEAILSRIKRGESVTGMYNVDYGAGPQIELRIGVPVIANATASAALLAYQTLDQSFLAEMTENTGLILALYADTKLVSVNSHLRRPDESLDIMETKKEILTSIFIDAERYTGEITIDQTPLLGTMLPLFDAEYRPIGMLFVGREQSGLFETLAKSITLTFMVTSALLVLSVGISYGIAKAIAAQL